MSAKGPITQGRRTLHFDSLDQVVADADALADADREGKLRKIGNWSLGQCCGHLAAWMDYTFEGIPLKLPRVLRIILRPMKNRFITKPMRSGGKIPGVAGGTLATDVLGTEEGLEKLRKACARLDTNAPTQPHPIFGLLTHNQWKQINLRHSELHLSFLRAN